jgi:DnaJ-class molecular chaperone
MAGFRCRACGGEGEFDYQPGEHACPSCGSPDVQFAILTVELPDGDPLVEAIRRLADGDEE